ncbi:MAG: hypothetical protein OHK0010_03950 [Anaerolineales bacterium]
MTSSTSQHSPENRHFGIWGRLALSRKLFLAFGALFIFAVIIAVATLYGLNRTTAAYEDTLAQGVAIRNISDLVTINLLQANRDSKDFLLRWRIDGYDKAYARYVPLYQQDIFAMRNALEQLTPFGPAAVSAAAGYTQTQYEAELFATKGQLDAYEQGFALLTADVQKRGSDVNTGLEGSMRTSAHNIEIKISGVPGLEALEITYLQLRRHEKDYIERNEQTYVNQVHDTVAQLKAQIAETDLLDAATKLDLQTQADSYLKTFDQIVTLDRQITTHTTDLANSAAVLQASVANFEKLGETIAANDVNRAHTNSTQTLAISVAIVFIALLMSVILAVALSQQLTNPIVALTRAAQQISGGKFDIQAEVASADEVGTLAQTFNVMTARLGQAFAEVNRRASELATVAEVGTATATILETDRLLQEVVDLTKERFNLYHSHIYLLDEAGENLVLAMGAGEAGAQMKAKGLSIPLNREQSLVARAARERKGVTVNDVTQAPDFLPNPLLPNTRSELAVPMIVGEKVIGVFDVQSDQVGRFGEADINIQTTLAAQVATSIQNLRSFEESKTRAELEALVNYLGQRIQRAGTVEETLQIALQEVSQVLGAERALVTLSAQDENPAQA